MSIDRSAAILLGTALALALAACGGGGEESGATVAANAAAPAGNAASPAKSEGSRAAAVRRDFTIVNSTGQAVTRLDVSPPNENRWGEDILARDMLGDGESARIGFARGEAQCRWDMRVTYRNGETGEWRGIDLCETATVTLVAE